MDDTCKHYAVWKRPDTKGQVLYDFHLYVKSRIDRSIETGSTLVIAGAEKGGIGGDS